MSHQTGPRTEEGKKASSQNNRHHGLATANLLVSPAERPFFDQLEADLRIEIQPDGALEDLAFRRLITAAWQMERCQEEAAALRASEAAEQNEASLERFRRYYHRWEGSYNSAFRQIRLLQTDRGCIAYNNGKPPDTLGPLADLPKIEQFARRIAQPVTVEDHVRKQLNNQVAIMRLEEEIRKEGRTPRSTADTPVQRAKSTTCETKSTQSQVGRNSPCPCGSGIKYKRCCGVNAPPILNHAA